MAGKGLSACDVYAFDVRQHPSVVLLTNADKVSRALLSQYRILLIVATYTALGFVSCLDVLSLN